MDLREKIKTNVSELCDEFGITKLAIFGSVARGEESSESDIDFFAEFELATPETMPDRYFGFIEAASRMFGRTVQVVTPRMLRNPHFIKAIERDLVTVHE